METLLIFTGVSHFSYLTGNNENWQIIMKNMNYGHCISKLFTELHCPIHYHMSHCCDIFNRLRLFVSLCTLFKVSHLTCRKNPAANSPGNFHRKNVLTFV